MNIQTIRLADIYQADLFTRSKALQLKEFIQPDAASITLDFEGISFMSRSFADELLNILEQRQFTCKNQNDEIQNMLSKVSESRQQERKRGFTNAQMLKFTDMQSLSAFLVAQ